MTLAVAAVAVVAGIILHELAHALAARLVGHDLFEITVGVGPAWERRLGGVAVRVGLVPVGGSVLSATPEPTGFRWRTATVALAGPAANLGLAGVCAAAGIQVGVVFNLVAAAANLWPGGRRRVGEPASDGRVALDMAWGRTASVAEERSAWWATQALAAHRDGRAEEAVALVADGVRAVGQTPSLLVVSGLLAMADRRFGDAVSAYAELIDDDRLPVAARAAVATDAAWAASLSGDPALTGLALPWAALGRRLEPKMARRRLVHALALVDAGQPERASQVLAGVDGPLAAAVDAMAQARAGDIAGARAIAATRVEGRLAPDHPLAERLARSLA